MSTLRFEPHYRDAIWGGGRIGEKFGRSNLSKQCAESWEIADRSEGMSYVLDGPSLGKSLHDLLSPQLLGLGRSHKYFPLLIKIIDAKEHLSVQVHPNEETAIFFQGEPKTEMWYVLEGGTVFVGFKKQIGSDEFAQALHQGKVPELLTEIEVHPGDVVYIPGGRVHAIGAGCMMLEVQQNSNTTYRVFDWGRQRALHTEQALKCIKWNDDSDPIIKSKFLEKGRFKLLSSPFFTIEKLEVSTKYQVQPDPKTFQIFFHVETAKTWLLPAVAEPFNLQEKGTYLKIFL